MDFENRAGKLLHPAFLPPFPPALLLRRRGPLPLLPHWLGLGMRDDCRPAALLTIPLSTLAPNFAQSRSSVAQAKSRCSKRKAYLLGRMGPGLWLGLAVVWSSSALSVGAAADLECMYMGYPDLEWDGRVHQMDGEGGEEGSAAVAEKDRTDALTEKTFNRTVFADGAKSVVFFNDIESDDDEWDQFECFLQVHPSPGSRGRRR